MDVLLVHHTNNGMEELEKVLQLQMKELDQIIERAEGFLKSAPEGKLRISSSRTYTQFYHITKTKDKHGKYIRKSEQNLINELAQKVYTEKILQKANTKRDLISKFRQEYFKERLTDSFQELSEPMRERTVPYVLSRELFIEKWKQEQNNKICMSFDEERKFQRPNEENGIITERGDAVRSKSEKIIADKLYIMKIPYYYEVPLCIQEWGYIYPDFIVLNARTRRQFYWEHFGMMDHSDYCEKTIRKIELYERNHIIPGKNLITTYETSNHALDIRAVKSLIEEFLL